MQGEESKTKKRIREKNKKISNNAMEGGTIGEKSIEKSLRHEDLIYFTFILSIIGLLFSGLWYFQSYFGSIKLFVDLLAIFITSILILLSIFRFVGVIFEENLLWRYISLHGIFNSLMLFAWYIIALLLIGCVSYLTYEVLCPPTLTGIKCSLIRFLPIVIFLIVVWIIPGYFYRIITFKLVSIKKYQSLLNIYAEKELMSILFSLYFFFISFSIFIAGLYLVGHYDLFDTKTYEGWEIIFVLSVIFLNSIYSLYRFFKLKQKENSNVKEEAKKFLKSFFKYLKS